MTEEHDAAEAFEALVEELLSLGATDLVRDIYAAVARGTTRPGEGKKSEKLTFQAALTPTEAFVVAVRLVVAALDPLFMIRDTRALLGKVEGLSREVNLIWAFDRLEGAEYAPAVFPSADEYIDPIRHLPEVEPPEFAAIQGAAVRLRYLCDQVLETEE